MVAKLGQAQGGTGHPRSAAESHGGEKSPMSLPNCAERRASAAPGSGSGADAVRRRLQARRSATMPTRGPYDKTNANFNAHSSSQ
jgi:hypothetical protein